MAQVNFSIEIRIYPEQYTGLKFSLNVKSVLTKKISGVPSIEKWHDYSRRSHPLSAYADFPKKLTFLTP